MTLSKKVLGLLAESKKWIHDQDADYWAYFDGPEEIGGVGNSNGVYMCYMIDDEYPFAKFHDLESAKSAVEDAV
jgi:hypothetical protein